MSEILFLLPTFLFLFLDEKFHFYFCRRRKKKLHVVVRGVDQLFGIVVVVDDVVVAVVDAVVDDVVVASAA